IYLRELGKYILLMLVMILLTASIIVDAVGQVKAERIINSFTGEKTRFVIHLTGKPHYTVTPDWLDNTISVSLSGVDHSDIDKDEIEKCKNYIVKSAKLSGNSNGLNFLIRTNGEFKVKYDFLTDRNRLYLDVYRNFEQVDLKTMLARASAYEDRGDHTNASVQYEQALSLNPGSDKIKYSIALNQMKSGDTGKAIDRLGEIGPESGYYSSAQDLIGQQSTKKSQEKPVAADKPEP
ncbi:MAG: tetratricopeptide repeat protein, partial [bacterium]|nr:tetratricopeptide repeat protein [bacterium]